ncbi:MAG: hypothetical protein KKH98_07055, partial [Spirochaetes bacterium]|nr:hypothetical protein [Spirochaetota bacterium]
MEASLKKTNTLHHIRGFFSYLAFPGLKAVRITLRVFLVFTIIAGTLFYYDLGARGLAVYLAMALYFWMLSVLIIIMARDDRKSFSNIFKWSVLLGVCFNGLLIVPEIYESIKMNLKGSLGNIFYYSIIICIGTVLAYFVIRVLYMFDWDLREDNKFLRSERKKAGKINRIHLFGVYFLDIAIMVGTMIYISGITHVFIRNELLKEAIGKAVELMGEVCALIILVIFLRRRYPEILKTIKYPGFRWIKWSIVIGIVIFFITVLIRRGNFYLTTAIFKIPEVL